MGFSGQRGIGRLSTTRWAARPRGCCRSPRWRLVAGLLARRGTPRAGTDARGLRCRGAAAITHALVVSYMTGIVHTYYTVAMAPAVGALVGMGGVELWRMRERPSTRWALSAAIAASGVWAYALLERTPDFAPGLSWLVLIASLAAAAVLLVRRGAAAPSRRPGRRRRSRGRAARRPGRVRDGHRQIDPRGRQPERRPHGRRRGGRPWRDGGWSAARRGRPPAAASPRAAPPGAAPGGGAAAPPQGALGGVGGGGGGGASANATLVHYLRAHRGSARWIAATTATRAAGRALRRSARREGTVRQRGVHRQRLVDAAGVGQCLGVDSLDRLPVGLAQLPRPWRRACRPPGVRAGRVPRETPAARVAASRSSPRSISTSGPAPAAAMPSSCRRASSVLPWPASAETSSARADAVHSGGASAAPANAAERICSARAWPEGVYSSRSRAAKRAASRAAGLHRSGSWPPGATTDSNHSAAFAAELGGRLGRLLLRGKPCPVALPHRRHRRRVIRVVGRNPRVGGDGAGPVPGMLTEPSEPPEDLAQPRASAATSASAPPAGPRTRPASPSRRPWRSGRR